MKPSYQMERSEFISELMARTLAQSLKCDWYRNEEAFKDDPADFYLCRDNEVKAFLKVLPLSDENRFREEHFLDLHIVNRCATTLKSLGIKFILARRAPRSIQFATFDGSEFTSIHVVRSTPDNVQRLGWIVDPVEFRRSIPLPDSKNWKDFVAGDPNV